MKVYRAFTHNAGRTRYILLVIMACVFMNCYLYACSTSGENQATESKNSSLTSKDLVNENESILQKGSNTIAEREELPIRSLFSSLLNKLIDSYYWNESTIQTIKNDVALVELHRINFDYTFNKNKNMGIFVDLTYPLVTSSEKNVETTKNDIINSIINQLIGEDFASDHLAFLVNALERNALDEFEGPGYEINITCEMSYFSENYVSFIYRVFFWAGGAHPFTNISLVTIDCSSGEPLAIDEVFDRENILNALATDHFSIEEGMYQPEGWLPDDIEVRSSVTKTIEKDLFDENIIRDYDTCYPTDFTLMSEKEILLKVYYADSLHGYVILNLLVDS